MIVISCWTALTISPQSGKNSRRLSTFELHVFVVGQFIARSPRRNGQFALLQTGVPIF